MEYAQERIATLHAYDNPEPTAPVDETAVVVPLADRDHATPAATQVFETLTALSPARVIVPLRADHDRVGAVYSWLSEFDLPLSVLWCNAPPVEAALADAGLSGTAGKGRDVWLALGIASEYDYVVVHDADTTSYDRTHVPRLLFPLANGFSFSKGYYARVENGRLYGRLCRLFVAPLLRALSDEHDEAILSYLSAFRYPLAGEFAVTGEMATHLRSPRGWGLEIGTLGDAFDHAGFDGSAQVDLGMHEHDHRPVAGTGGLGVMAKEVGQTLFTVLEEHGISPAYERLPERYQSVGNQMVIQYGADARFNGLSYDAEAERAQLERYCEAIAPPEIDDRLPAWTNAPVDPALIAERSEQALSNVRASPTRNI